MLTFVAGTAADVFGPGPFAETVSYELRSRFGFEAAVISGPYESEPVDGAGWRDLMLGVDPYQAVYIPAALANVEHVAIPNAAEPLQVAGLTALIEKLTAFAEQMSLPVDELELMALGAKYLEDDALFDRDLDVQAYVQLMLSAKQAVARKQALWVVS